MYSTSDGASSSYRTIISKTHNHFFLYFLLGARGNIPKSYNYLQAEYNFALLTFSTIIYKSAVYKSIHNVFIQHFLPNLIISRNFLK